jgi:outer membrane protein TolC
MGKLRVKVQELQDQERALQLQVNQLTSQFLAPVSDQTSRDQAQARIGETQNRLTAVRAELDQAKKTLDAMQLQGPPKQ